MEINPVDALNVIRPSIFNTATIIEGAPSSGLPDRSTPSTKSIFPKTDGSHGFSIGKNKEISKQIDTFLTLKETRIDYVINKDNGDVMVNIVQSASGKIIREIPTGLTNLHTGIIDIRV
jgi:hypothetical protein